MTSANESIRALQAEFGVLAETIESKVEELFATAAQQFKSDVTSIGAKLGTTAEEINELNASNSDATAPASQ